MNGEGSMDLLISQVSNRTLIRRVVKKESERSFPFSMHSDMSVSDMIFDLFEKKGRRRTYPNNASASHWTDESCVYMFIYVLYICL